MKIIGLFELYQWPATKPLVLIDVIILSQLQIPVKGAYFKTFFYIFIFLWIKLLKNLLVGRGV